MKTVVVRNIQRADAAGLQDSRGPRRVDLA